MKMQKRRVWDLLSVFLMLMFFCVGSTLFDVSRAVAQQGPSKATVAVLSHTDFLPDSTGVYGDRAAQAGPKNPITGQDEAYKYVQRKYGYDPESVGLPEVLADTILEQLSKSKRFIPVERKALRTAILEQRFGPTLTNSNIDNVSHDYRDLGSASGASLLVLGNLKMLGTAIEAIEVPLTDSDRVAFKKTAEARIQLRVVETNSSTVVGADSLHVEVSSVLFEGSQNQGDDFEFLEHVSKEAALKILDIVFPAKIVSVEPLVISRGSIDGVQEGDEYAIVREGKQIQESTGAVIARLQEPVGKVKVTKLQDTISIVNPIEGESFLNGDLVLHAQKTDGKISRNRAVPLKKTSDVEHSELPRVAVGLVKVGSTAKTGPDADKHVPTFTDSIISRLVQSRRFTVVDRQEVDQLIDEQLAQAIVENRDLPSVMGTLNGCDYLIIGSLQNFSMEENSIKLPNSSRVIEVLEGFSEGNMRLVDARSGDVMESRKIVVEEQLDIDTGEDRLIAALADRYAAQVVANLLNAVYPMKVAAVAPDETIYINRGSDGNLNQGSVFDVMRPGQKITDPDTGVELGSMESKIGQLQIIVVEDNRSVGKMIEGSAAQKGDLLKLVGTGEKDGSEGPEARTGPMITGSMAAPSSAGMDQQQKRGKPTLALTRVILNEGQKASANTKNFTLQQNTLEILTDELIDSLSKTNRFTMMERGQIDQVIDEKTFQAIAQGADIRDYLKELEGSDYVAVAKLTKFILRINKEKVPYLDETTTSIQAVAEGNIRIVDSHTSRIVATEDIRISKNYKKIKVDEAHSRLIDLYTTEAAAAIVDRLYPTRILAVLPDGTIFVNRGADAGMTMGSTFSVERPGEDLVDKDTGIVFGQAETTIGSLQINSIEAFRSRAKMVNGGVPLEGDILRNESLPVKPKLEPRKKVAW